MIDMSNPYVLDFQYVEPDKRQQYALGVALKYCKKPMDGIVLGGEKVVAQCLEAMQQF